jgi:hypothetical protein
MAWMQLPDEQRTHNSSPKLKCKHCRTHHSSTMAAASCIEVCKYKLCLLTFHAVCGYLSMHCCGVHARAVAHGLEAVADSTRNSCS